MDWWNLMKKSVTVGGQLSLSGRYGCNNGRYGCAIVMSYTKINTAGSQRLLTFNLCVSVTCPVTCAFHIHCTHTPEIIDMHRDVCDKKRNRIPCWQCFSILTDIVSSYSAVTTNVLLQCSPLCALQFVQARSNKTPRSRVQLQRASKATNVSNSWWLHVCDNSDQC